MLAGLTPTKFGRTQSVPPVQLHRFHRQAEASALREIQHEVPLPVLDQEDLAAQQISTSRLVKGAADVNALGSCTCNAGTAHLAERLAAAGKDISAVSLPAADGSSIALSATDSRADEEFAILLYHLVTDQTGSPASEWPPTDCGSSGFYVCEYLERLKLASTYHTGAGVTGALSMLQAGTVMQGAPWFKSWMQPEGGFIDGDGSFAALMAALESGVAGGHETLITGIPQLAVTGGEVDLHNTVLEVRNSWSSAWNGKLAGSYYVHASTLAHIAHWCDFKQVTV